MTDTIISQISKTTIQRIDRVTGLATRHRPIREISFRGHDDLSSPVSLAPQPLFQWPVVVFVVQKRTFSPNTVPGNVFGKIKDAKDIGMFLTEFGFKL